jgi:hypothetical protein
VRGGDSAALAAVPQCYSVCCRDNSKVRRVDKSKSTHELPISQQVCVVCPFCSCRSTYNAVARDFPLSARQVLENLKKRAQQVRGCLS